MKVKTMNEWLDEKSKVEEVNGVRVVPKSEINVVLFTYDEIERTDGSGRFKKGTPKEFEIERFQEDFGIDITNFKKSDFPFMYDYSSKKTQKVKFIEEDIDSSYTLSTIKVPKTPTNMVYIYFWDDNQMFLIHKEDVEQFVDLDTKQMNDVLKVVSNS